MENESAYLTWIDLTASDRAKVRRVLDLFSEQGTVDELGLGKIRDFLSESMFPGTSVLHTRLRYVLFVPWLYQSLERRHPRVNDVASEARALELRLVGALKAGGDHNGIIGARAGQSLSRLPSSAYWAALVRWGIFVPNQSQSWYFRHFHSLAKQETGGRPDDPGATSEREHTWHPHLPEPPDGLLESASFALSSEEAEFIQGCIETKTRGSLLAWLSREGSSDIASQRWAWDVPQTEKAPEHIREILELARRFSLHVAGAPLLYNLLLAETRRQYYGDPQGLEEAGIEKYRKRLADWAAQESREDEFDPRRLWRAAESRGVSLRGCLRYFVEQWTAGVNNRGAEAVVKSRELRGLIEWREKQLKGGRARLADENRLLDWKGDVGVGRMSFRWPQVSQSLTDLHVGLGS